MQPRNIHNERWVIASFSKPLLYARDADETWLLNPPRRYILTAGIVEQLKEHAVSVSDLASAALYRPLRSGVPIAGARVLVERLRERGIGDLLFMTGVFSYLHHVTGGRIKLDCYALADRGQVLCGNPAMYLGTPLVGPVHYDDFPLYDFHWMVDPVTEHDEERDQANVYDALFRQIGVNPENVHPRFKRPTAALIKDDYSNLDAFYFWVFNEKKVDLRKTGYYVVAPFSNSSLRSMPYGTWLKIIQALVVKRPVIVVGQMHDRVPVTDMCAGDFINQFAGMPGQVINATGLTSVRLLMAIIAKANAAVCLDSGTLYIAQAFNTPAVSIWGTHNPAVRIGYDKAYMDLAVWEKDFCRRAPCFAYSYFPQHKCPRGENQHVCEVLAFTDPDHVLGKIDQVESANSSASVVQRADSSV